VIVTSNVRHVVPAAQFWFVAHACRQKRPWLCCRQRYDWQSLSWLHAAPAAADALAAGTQYRATIAWSAEVTSGTQAWPVAQSLWLLQVGAAGGGTQRPLSHKVLVGQGSLMKPGASF
jgi:hypothetical protein